MNKLVVEISEENLIELDIKIHNDSVTINESDVKVRMVVDGDNNLSYFFDGKKSGDSYAVRVPRLKGTLGIGERECFIEVVCYDRYFKAWEGVVELQEATKVEVSPTNKNNIMENTKIEINPVAKVIEKPKQEIIQEKNEEKIEIKEDTKVIDEKTKLIKEKKEVSKKDNVVFEIVMDRPVKNKPKKKVFKETKNIAKKKNNKKLSLGSLY